MSNATTKNKTLPTTPRSALSQNVNIRKVAVVMSGYQAQLLELDQKRPLAAIIQGICDYWSLHKPSKYSLQINEASKTCTFITERNRHKIQNGTVLSLSTSPSETAKAIISKLRHEKNKLSSAEKLDVLQQLVGLASDSTFATEFIKKDGLLIVIGLITGGKLEQEALALTLRSFVCLMDHEMANWEKLESNFIHKVAECVIVGKNAIDIVCLQSSLEILESVVLHCPGMHVMVQQLVHPKNMIPHLESINSEVQKNALALINAFFTRTDHSKRSKFAESVTSKTMRNAILTHVIRQQQIGTAMAHQLYVMQIFLMNLHEQRMKTPIDSHDQVIVRDVEELRRIAFEIDGDPNMNAVRRSHSAARDFKKLGFENLVNPADDFVVAQCGLLSLDCMMHFAQYYGENYVKVVVENSSRADEHDCPFLRASVHLTKMLCDILKIGEAPDDTGTSFYSMFFSVDKPFEEFFCVVIQLLHKTWREMRATTADFPKVLEVVKEQVVRALSTHSSSFEAFRNRVFVLTYSEIVKIMESERRVKEEFESQIQPVVELRKKLIPDILGIVRRQRLQYIMEGTCFPKYGSRVGRIKDKFWCWRLSPNHKAFHYGDCAEGLCPKIEELSNKLSLVDIMAVLTGKDCPHMAISRVGIRRNNQLVQLAFCITTEAEEDFCFVASMDKEFDMWCDALNCLQGNDMTSGQVQQDVEMLLSMEIKIQLLDAEGLQIPADRPVYPSPPENFNFAYINMPRQSL